MKTILKPHGDGYIIEIDRQTVEDWKVDPGDTLEVQAMDGILTLAPVHDPQRMEKIDAALKRVIERYGETLKRLAE